MKPGFGSPEVAEGEGQTDYGEIVDDPRAGIGKKWGIFIAF
jgi:hypothetical protein